MSRVGDALLRLRGEARDATPLAPSWLRPADVAAADVPWRFDKATEPPARSELGPESKAHPHSADEAAPPLPAPIRELDTRIAERVITSEQMSSHVVEHYRRLAATLHQAHGPGMRVVMITSAVVGEGKSLTATNVALTLSQSYRRRVLLIDADLRRPTLHTIFQLPPSEGLSDGLRTGTAGAFTTFRHSSTLSVLPAGRPETDPMAALTSPRMSELVKEAREQFDWVVIDTPPVSLMPDAKLLAAMADGVLLVVAAGIADVDAIKQAVKAVGRKKVLGVVLNRADDEPTAGYYYQD